MAEENMGVEQGVNKHQKIEIDSSMNLSGEQIQKYRRQQVPRESGMTGSVLENLGAKASLTEDQWEVMLEPDLTDDNKRDRIKMLQSKLHKLIGRETNKLNTGEATIEEVEQRHRELREARSHLPDKMKTAPARVKAGQE